MLPDADAVSFWFNVPHGSIWSHRGITHSIFFAALVAVVVAPAVRKARTDSWWIVLYFFLVTLSHPLLDMLTDGGPGVALLAPFSAERYFWPWRPIEVSPIGLAFFSERGVFVFVSEVVWVWLPAGVALAVRYLYEATRKKN